MSTNNPHSVSDTLEETLVAIEEDIAMRLIEIEEKLVQLTRRVDTWESTLVKLKDDLK